MREDRENTNDDELHGTITVRTASPNRLRSSRAELIDRRCVDGAVRLWDAAGRARGTLEGLRGTVNCLTPLAVGGCWHAKRGTFGSGM